MSMEKVIKIKKNSICYDLCHKVTKYESQADLNL